MSYRDALAWIYSFSDYERSGTFTRDRENNLARERGLLAALDNPHLAYGVTHIAGSKGKGSTAAMVAAILSAAGVRTGLYTQPDLHTFRERIRVGDRLISEEEVAELVPALQQAVARAGTHLGPYITYEIGTTLAFLYFQRAGVQHAVIEVGLGGRLDATNVVEPKVAVITSISFEHMEVLGHTLAEITGEKAGIVKPGVPTVCSARAPEALAVITGVCAARGSRLIVVGPEGTHEAAYAFSPGRVTPRAQWLNLRTPAQMYTDLELGLIGEHQMENAAATVAAVDQLRAAGLRVDDAALREGLRTVRWPARLQVVGERPWLVVDAAHNADSMERLFAALHRHFTYDRLILVLGLLADKDLAGIARVVGEEDVAELIATASNSARAMPPERISAALAEGAPHVPVRVAAPVDAALQEALAVARAGDLVCVAGSVYLAGEALRWSAAHDGAARYTTGQIAGVDH